MTLGEKLRYLRSMEGTLRGLNRDMTQQEVVAAIKAESNEVAPSIVVVQELATELRRKLAQP